MENNSNKSFFEGLIIFLVVSALFISGTFLGSLGGKAETDTTEDTQAEEVIADSTNETPTQAPETTAPTTQPSTQAPTDNAADTSTAPATQTTDAPSSAVPSTKAEIIALFNESANKVKTDATKVVKNYEDREHLEEYLDMPKILEGTANSLMSSVFKDDVDPIEYATKEEIVAQYQVPDTDFVSHLTEAEVEEATCTDNGAEYEIMLKLYPTKDPEPDVGVAKAFDTITPSEIKESAPPMLETFSTEYFDCVIKCKIDKATGHTTWANYYSPVIMNVTVKMGGTMNARLGLSFEKDYTITY